MRVLRLLLVAGFSLLGCSSDPDQPSGEGGAGGGTGPGTGGDGGGAGGTGGAGGAGLTGAISGDIKQYTYAFDIATGHATAGIDVAVAAPGGDCFSTSLTLASVSAATWNGAPAKSATVAGGAVTFCGEGVAEGAPLAITADVDVPKKTFLGLDVGFSKRKDLAGGYFTYLLSWVGGCDRFGPCDADPSRLTSFLFKVSHGANDVVLCPGELTPGASMTQCSLVGGALAPTYSSFGIASDPLWQKNAFLQAAGLDIVFYEVPGGKIAQSLQKPSVSAYLTWITGLLGPYPYGKQIRYAGGPTTWLGFEHPANIILNEDLPSAGAYQDPTMHVFMHETVHQWAGDRSTIASVPDFVWKEATAEYLSYVFEDEQRPPGEAAASLAYWDAISLQSQHYPRPNDSPTPDVEAFYGDVYGPGPMTLYVQLETMLGRQAVLDGIKGFLAQPGARSVDDLRAALEVSSGKDLKPYFDAWVFGTGIPEWPTFDVSTAQVGDQVTVTVTQQNLSKKLYGCKLDIEVKGATTNVTAAVDFGVAPMSATATATVTLAEPVVSTVLDPSNRVVGRLVGSPVGPGPVLPVWLL